MTEPPESSSSSRARQLLAAAVIGAVGVVAITVAVSHQQSSPADDTGANTGANTGTATGASSTLDPSARDARAIAALAAQDRALRQGSADKYTGTWDGSAAVQRQAGVVFANLAALRVDGLNARYVASDTGGLSSDELRRLGGSAWTADVDVAWRLRGIDRADARTTLTYTFAARPGGKVVVANITPAAGEHEPIWLLGRLDVRRTDRTLVAATSRALAERLDGALRQAALDVRRVLPDWHGRLVCYGPSSREQFDAVVAAPPNTYEGIAAVTTTVDGSRNADAPVAVIVNPTVFDALGPIGAHVVITHEATHQATGATTVSMPLWVAEGFADYVGVGSVDVPLSVSAQAAVRDIRRAGVPRRLPDNAAFQARDGVEATYEEAWLAIRLIARDYGQDKLVAFYEDVIRHPDALEAAMRTNLGISPAALTRAWRAELRRVAGVG